MDLSTLPAAGWSWTGTASTGTASSAPSSRICRGSTSTQLPTGRVRKSCCSLGNVRVRWREQWRDAWTPGIEADRCAVMERQASDQPSEGDTQHGHSAEDRAEVVAAPSETRDNVSLGDAGARRASGWDGVGLA